MRWFVKIFVRSTASLIIVLFLFLSASACRQSSSIEPSKGNDDAAAGLTRQEFYYEIYHEILNDDLLRSVYLPHRTRLDSIALLCGTDRYENDTYEERMRLRKAESAFLTDIETLKYRQPGASGIQEETRWIWRSPGEAAKLWEGLLSDFSIISEKNREAAVFLCESGLARICQDPNTYTLALYPDEPVSAEEAASLRNTIRSYSRIPPVHAIKTYDPEGNEILLCFSDPISLFTFKNLMSYLDAQKEAERTFVYFDEAGARLSLWISSVTGGMIAVPLDLAYGSICNLPYYANPALEQQRLGIAAAMLPEIHRVQFLEQAGQTFQNAEKQPRFHYVIGESGPSVSVTFSYTDKDTGTIRIRINDHDI